MKLKNVLIVVDDMEESIRFLSRNVWIAGNYETGRHYNIV